MFILCRNTYLRILHFSFFTVPASFNQPFTNQTVLIGDKAIVVCNALGDNPIKIRWLRNHQFLEKTPPRMKVYTSILCKNESNYLLIKNI